MRHRVDHRKLGRTTEHRIAMLRNQTVSLVQHDRIKTTLSKAKELRRFVEKLISLAKKDTLHARRLAARHVQDPEALKKLFSVLGPLYASRSGGYTRILKLGFRRGDSAQEAIIELVGREPKFESTEAKGKKKPRSAKKAPLDEEAGNENNAPARKKAAKGVAKSKAGAEVKAEAADVETAAEPKIASKGKSKAKADLKEGNEAAGEGVEDNDAASSKNSAGEKKTPEA